MIDSKLEEDDVCPFEDMKITGSSFVRGIGRVKGERGLRVRVDDERTHHGKSLEAVRTPIVGR
jgi:hypothetical protein